MGFFDKAIVNGLERTVAAPAIIASERLAQESLNLARAETLGATESLRLAHSVEHLSPAAGNLPASFAAKPFSSERMMQFENDGTIHFGLDNVASVRSGPRIGEQHLFQAMSLDSFILYEKGATPAITSNSLQRGLIHGDTATAGGAGSYSWAKLSAKELEAVEQAIPSGSVPLGVGRMRQAWMTPNDEVVVFGPKYNRPETAGLLPVRRRQFVESQRIDWLPYADSRDITRADIKAVNKVLYKAGYQAGDNVLANYGRTVDGRVWRTDPGGLMRFRK